jgi:hypothetical protein
VEAVAILAVMRDAATIALDVLDAQVALGAAVMPVQIIAMTDVKAVALVHVKMVVMMDVRAVVLEDVKEIVTGAVIVQDVLGAAAAVARHVQGVRLLAAEDVLQDVADAAGVLQGAGMDVQADAVQLVQDVQMLAVADVADVAGHAEPAALLFAIQHVLMPVIPVVRQTVIIAATKVVQAGAGETVQEI